jgi:ERCC4-type nuclease
MSSCETVKMYVDYREKQLLKYLEIIKQTCDNQIEIESKNLNLADVHIVFGENEILVERKTLSDLNSSIMDGRYREQSFRLDGSDSHNHNIFYLIEESRQLNPQFRSMNKNTLYSTMCSIACYKGFSLLRTQSTEETAQLLYAFAKKMLKNAKQAFYYKKTGETSHETPVKEYTSVIRSDEKKKNITVDNIDAIMMMQIPFVSHQIANVIMNTYGTIGGLIQALKNNDKCLNDLKCGNRKISKRALENICIYLHVHEVSNNETEDNGVDE